MTSSSEDQTNQQTCSCGKPADSLMEGKCQDCWEAECDRTWWAELQGTEVRAEVAKETPLDGIMLDGNPLITFEKTLSSLTPEVIREYVKEMEAEAKEEKHG